MSGVTRWGKIRWRNRRWRSRVNYCWSYLVQRWSLRNGGNLGAERIWRRLGIIWTSDESSDVTRRVGGWGTRVAILDGVRFWPLHSYNKEAIIRCVWSFLSWHTSRYRLGKGLEMSMPPTDLVHKWAKSCDEISFYSRREEVHQYLAGITPSHSKDFPNSLGPAWVLNLLINFLALLPLSVEACCQ